MSSTSANTKKRTKGKNVKPLVTKQQAEFVLRQTMGESWEDCVWKIFGKRPDDDGYDFYRRKLSTWARDPHIQEMSKNMLREKTAPIVSLSVKKLYEQLQDTNPWIVQNAIRIALQFFGEEFFQKDEKALTVKIEGMPTIGTPEDAEGDGVLSADGDVQ